MCNTTLEKPAVQTQTDSLFMQTIEHFINVIAGVWPQHIHRVQPAENVVWVWAPAIGFLLLVFSISQCTMNAFLFDNSIFKTWIRA